MLKGVNRTYPGNTTLLFMATQVIYNKDMSQVLGCTGSNSYHKYITPKEGQWYKIEIENVDGKPMFTAADGTSYCVWDFRPVDTKMVIDYMQREREAQKECDIAVTSIRPNVVVLKDYDGFFGGWANRLADEIQKGGNDYLTTIEVTSGPYRSCGMAYEMTGTTLKLDFYSAVRNGFGSIGCTVEEFAAEVIEHLDRRIEGLISAQETLDMG